MEGPDLINASFEAFGTVMTLLNVKTILRDKQVKGFSIWPVIFWTAWGAWNCFYYPYLGQWASFFAGATLFLANLWYIILIWRYRRG